MIRNDYLSIAENDLLYLESIQAVGSTFYNQLSIQCQQIAEKFLRGYCERIFLEEDVTDLLRKHNIKKIASKMNEWRPELDLDTMGLAYLTDFYYDAKYPGDDFYTVSKADYEKCVSVMYDTVTKLKTIHLEGL